MFLKTIFKGFLDILYPPRCCACGELTGVENYDGGICRICSISIIACESPLCPVCGLPYQGAAGPDHECVSCAASTPPFTKLRSAFHYGGSVHDMITSFKYRGKIHAGANLLGLSIRSNCLDEISEDRTMIAPVPLHFMRLARRGFNQSAILAGMISSVTGIPFNPGLLQRTRNTPPQTKLSGAERVKNVKGAFRVSSPRRLKGQCILLVDDVFTTGSTVKECARTLLQAGAESVNVFTLARVV